MPNKTFITNMFDTISSKYDLLNNLLSLGTHHLWKKKLVNKISKQNPQSVLDGATGTGDIAISLAQFCPKVVGVDISQGMLAQAQEKKTSAIFKYGDLCQLDFPENEFDVSCVSFGVRNVENLNLCLSELIRVTKSKIYILEFGTPENLWFKNFYFGLMKIFIPLMGKLFSNHKAYSYLIDSSTKFPSGKKFLEHVPDQENVSKKVKGSYETVFAGIAYLYEISLERKP